MLYRRVRQTLCIVACAKAHELLYDGAAVIKVSSRMWGGIVCWKYVKCLSLLAVSITYDTVIIDLKIFRDV